MVRLPFIIPVLVWAHRETVLDAECEKDETGLLQMQLKGQSAAGVAGELGQSARQAAEHVADGGLAGTIASDALGATDELGQSTQQSVEHVADKEGMAMQATELSNASSAFLDTNFAAEGLVYIKSAGDNNVYFHNHGGNVDDASGTLSSCHKENDPENCQWSFERSNVDDLLWYIKAKGTRLYAHAAGGGTSQGNEERLHPCPMLEEYPNCQWFVESSPTRPDHIYIRVSSGPMSTPLYLSVYDERYSEHWGSPTGYASVRLNTCHKNLDTPNCQWKLERACQDHRDTQDCIHWAGLGRCDDDDEIKNMCQRTCGQCGAETDLSAAAVGVEPIRRGVWELVSSSMGGVVEYSITEGVGREDGTAVTEEAAHTFGLQLQHTIIASASLFGIGVGSETTIGVNYEHSRTMASEISQSVTKSMETSFTVTCGDREASLISEAHLRAWLYQWVIYDGKHVVRTAHTRCHYTDGIEHAPQCPFTACGPDNEWCETDKCDNFRMM